MTSQNKQCQLAKLNCNQALHLKKKTISNCTYFLFFLFQQVLVKVNSQTALICLLIKNKNPLHCRLNYIYDSLYKSACVAIFRRKKQIKINLNKEIKFSIRNTFQALRARRSYIRKHSVNFLNRNSNQLATNKQNEK